MNKFFYVSCITLHVLCITLQVPWITLQLTKIIYRKKWYHCRWIQVTKSSQTNASLQHLWSVKLELLTLEMKNSLIQDYKIPSFLF